MFVRYSFHWLLRCNAVDGAINSALGSSGIPYLRIVTSLANFEDNPAQSIGSLVGMYFGGPIGAAIGGAIFKYDLAGYTLANGARGFMYLEWTDEQVQTQARYYVGAGSRGKAAAKPRPCKTSRRTPWAWCFSQRQPTRLAS